MSNNLSLACKAYIIYRIQGYTGWQMECKSLFYGDDSSDIQHFLSVLSVVQYGSLIFLWETRFSWLLIKIDIFFCDDSPHHNASSI